MNIIEEVSDTVYKGIPPILEPINGGVSAITRLSLCTTNDGEIFGKFTLSSDGHDVHGSVLLDTDAGVSYGGIHFINGAGEMYNYGKSYGRMIMSIGMVMMPNMPIQQVSNLNNPTTTLDFKVMLGVVSGVQTLYAHRKLVNIRTRGW